MFTSGRKQPVQPDLMGRLPAWYAAMEGRTTDVTKALQKGLDPNHAGTDGITLLGVAAHYSRLEVIRVLLANGADPNRPNRHGNGPLWEATRQASMRTPPGEPAYDREIVALLLAAGADPAHANSAGTRPAGWAEHCAELQSIYRTAGYTGHFRLDDSAGQPTHEDNA